jgi:hypothetical protein
MSSSFQWTNGKISTRIADPFVIIGRIGKDDQRLDTFTMAKPAGGWLYPASASDINEIPAAQYSRPAGRLSPFTSPRRADCNRAAKGIACGNFSADTEWQSGQEHGTFGQAYPPHHFRRHRGL